MTKQELNSIISDSLKENDRIAECMQNLSGSLRITSSDGDGFTVRTDNADEARMRAVSENFVPIMLSAAVSGLFDLGIMSRKNADRYLKRLGQNLDMMKPK